MGACEPILHRYEEPLKAQLTAAIELGPLPAPRGGSTLARWRAFARVAGQDLALAKLYESHWDAAAILREVAGRGLPAGTQWGVWCAEPPGARVQMRRAGAGFTLHGTKAWCSGAHFLSHALVSAWNEDGQPVLAAVDLRAAGCRPTPRGWAAVGMAGTESVEVEFDGARAEPIGGSGSYTERPGFWAGSAGIAACWYGSARAIGEVVARACAAGAPDSHRLAHLGAIDVALASSAAALREAARALDGGACVLGPREIALRTRAVVERDCKEVMDRAGRALGAAPLCQDAWFARAMADLPVFLRQSHAERELCALGIEVSSVAGQAWAL